MTSFSSEVGLVICMRLRREISAISGGELKFIGTPHRL